MKLKTFDRGVHPRYHKELTSGKRIERAGPPKTAYIPLQQHIGAPCEPLVKKGDTVEEGQKIGDAKAFVSAPVHASISGKVKDIDLHPHPQGGRVPTVIVQGDGTAKEWTGEGTGLDLDSLSPRELREIIREAGIAGMGGRCLPHLCKTLSAQGYKDSYGHTQRLRVRALSYVRPQAHGRGA